MADVLAPPADAPAEAPMPRGSGPVLQAGLATTFITLAGLFLLGHYNVDFNPTGLYLWYVVPVGAIIIGGLAGSGYGLMSWLRGVRIVRPLLIAIVVLQLLSYAAAEYLAYRDVLGSAQKAAEAEGETIEPPGFFRYFHHKTQDFAFKKKNSKETGEPLGMWGYLFVGLAAAGFVGGGLMGPLATAALPYCESCQRYMKTKKLGLIPASVANRKYKKADRAEGEAEWAADNDAVSSAAEKHADGLLRLAEAGDAAGFQQAAAVAFGDRKPTDKLPVRLSTELTYCPDCRRGWMWHYALSGQGKEVKRVRVAGVEVAAPLTNGVLGHNA